MLTSCCYVLLVMSSRRRSSRWPARSSAGPRNSVRCRPARPPPCYPPRTSPGTDVGALRFQQTLRGYKSREVDWALDRLAAEIDALRAQVRELSAEPAPERRVDAVAVTDDRVRCAWAHCRAQLNRDYHDTEWGRPVHGRDALFERLCLEAFQSGFSWLTILRKRAAFRAAFAGFESGGGGPVQRIGRAAPARGCGDRAQPGQDRARR